MKQTKIIHFSGLSMLLLLMCTFFSCSDWTDTEAIDTNIKNPWMQNPALWAQYTSELRAYKQSEHMLTYARLANAPQSLSCEKDFMRCLPDSLDIVTLTNADNFSKYDLQDVPTLHEKGTKILYQVDYAARIAELNNAAALEAYLDKVVSSVKANGLDGYSFTGIPCMGSAEEVAAVASVSALIVRKLSADDGKLLVFEGNPLFVCDADRTKVDYFVLDTEQTENTSDVRLQVLGATGSCAIPASKLLLAARVDASIKDEERVDCVAISEMARRVVSFGPLCGVAFYNIGSDYYGSDMNYKKVRQVLQSLNPSK